MAGMTVKALSGLGAVMAQETRHRGRSKASRNVQPEREYRTFESKAAITAAVSTALAAAETLDETLKTAYLRIVASGLMRQAEGEQPWTFGNQTGINRDAALRLELAGLIKTGRKGSMIARLFFSDAGPVVSKQKAASLDAVIAGLFGGDDDETETE